MRPALIVTVDTEEEGLWSSAFRHDGHTVENTRGLERFQLFCSERGFAPTYLIDTPVVDDDRSVESLRAWQEAGECEVGAHLHPWCAPPFQEETTARNSFTCNLPEPLQREKLTRLTGAIEARLGRRPTSFRAGRYGLDPAGARILEDLGYRVDSSVIPFHDYSAEEGPDFRRAPFTPYLVGGDRLDVPAPEGSLLEVPVSVGYPWGPFGLGRFLRDLGRLRWARWLRVVGIFDRLGPARRVKLSPEQAGAREMNHLLDRLLHKGAPCAVLLLHSSSLVAGLSPYVPDAARLERVYADLGALFEHCRARGVGSATLSGFARAMRGCREEEADSRAGRNR